MGQPLPPDVSNPETTNTVLTTGTNTQPLNTITYNPPTTQYFTAEQLEAARQQEKDKLYAKMQQQQEQLDAFRTDMESYKQEREAAQAAAQKAADEAAAAKKLADEEKLSVKELLDKRDAEWKARQEEWERKVELERAVMQKDRELMTLQNYIQRRVNEEQDNIIPDLIEFIDGDTPEEVEASITRLKEKSASIIEGRQRMLSGQTVSPGVSPTGFAPTGPLDNLSGPQEITPEQIRNMSTAEYAKYRAQVGIDKAGNNKGLFN